MTEGQETPQSPALTASVALCYIDVVGDQPYPALVDYKRVTEPILAGTMVTHIISGAIAKLRTFP
jgi:hypothetical protein